MNVVSATPTPKERMRDTARILAGERTGKLAEFFEAQADELDRQIAFDAARAAGNASGVASSAPGAAVKTPTISGTSTQGASGALGSDAK